MTIGKLIGYLSVIVVLLAVLFYLVYKGPNVNEINLEIARSNYCGSEFDCTEAISKCPFDCNIYVNKGDVDRVNKLIENFDSDCITHCSPPEGVSCFQNKCKAN